MEKKDLDLCVEKLSQLEITKKFIEILNEERQCWSCGITFQLKNTIGMRGCSIHKKKYFEGEGYHCCGRSIMQKGCYDCDHSSYISATYLYVPKLMVELNNIGEFKNNKFFTDKEFRKEEKLNNVFTTYGEGKNKQVYLRIKILDDQDKNIKNIYF